LNNSGDEFSLKSFQSCEKVIKYAERLNSAGGLASVENMEFAWQVLLLGFFVVLVTLFLLYFVLIIFSKLLYRPVREVNPAAASGRRTAKAHDTVSEIPPRVVAAITAAVYSYTQGHTAVPGRIIIASATRPGLQKTWAAAGRKALIESGMALQHRRRNKSYEKI
jgi:Na+-transporting methylmalonyl-CoA/oxaloacetate decarboxylase gamma subunit